MTLLLLVLAIGLAVLLAVGLRGRRVDDHPVCRRCEFDLTGRPATSAHCGECGADLSRPRAVRVGHRVRRRWAVAVGSLVLVSSGVVGGLLASP